MKRFVPVAALLCSCATVPTARQDVEERAKDLRPPAGAANVYVYRPGSVLGMAVTLHLFFDEVRAGALASSTFALIEARPGEHKLLVRATGTSELTLVVEPGRNYYVRATPAWGSNGANVSLELVDDERLARDDIRECHLIASAAAESIRRAANRIAELNVDPIRPEPLVAEAIRALEAIDGPPEPPQPRDLDATIARLRALHPGMGDPTIVRVAATAMAASLHPKPGPDALASSRATDWNCGLILRREGQGTAIAGVLPDSPAAAARLEAGLEVRGVNGQSTRDHSPSEVARLLAGTEGSQVALTVGRAGEPDQTAVLRRAPADAGAVDCRILDGRVLYLRPWGLWTATARRVRDHGRSAGAPARLVILDLRDNPGGAIDGARDLADSFLAEGTILSVAEARDPELARTLNETYSATPGTSALEHARLVVLINANTGGLAEAVAAAVQDNRRGTLLGTRSAGTARIEVWYRVAGTKVPIPAARVLRASGQPLEGRGVTPDAVGASTPAPSAAWSDVACPRVSSPGAVSNDPEVRRAVDLLLASPVSPG